jgi:predicted RNA-binding protein with PUA-like domain
MNYWLIKSEEHEYSIEDLKRDRKIGWFGVRNYQARNFMRDHMKKGDLVLFYYSNGKPSGVIGVGKVVSLPYADGTQFKETSIYYDKKATKEKPIWTLVDIAFVKKYSRLLSINEMRMTHELDGMVLLQKGSRLSITPVSKKHFEYIDTLLSVSEKKINMTVRK